MELESIYSDYKDKVLAYLYGKLGKSALAEDLCSEVFVKIAGSLSRYDPQRASLSTWVYCIARNTLYDHYRTRHETEPLDESFADAPGPEESLCTQETLEQLADALSSLSRRDRELIIRHYYSGQTLRETALALGLSYSYVKLLHKTILQKLKKYLENQ